MGSQLMKKKENGSFDLKAIEDLTKESLGIIKSLRGF
jgi:hypothetical protein